MEEKPMGVESIASNTGTANAAQLNAQVKADQATAATQVQQDTQKAAPAIKKDTVTISKQALQLVSDGDTAAQEAKEGAAEQASEKLRGKK
jgi:hypothetical protein